MRIAATREYKVLLIPQPLTAPDGSQQWRWWATVLGFPYIVEEACSREQVIDQLKARIDEITRHAEIVTLTAPALPLGPDGTEQDLATQGWDDHGLFRDDPEALQLFDAI